MTSISFPPLIPLVLGMIIVLIHLVLESTIIPPLLHITARIYIYIIIRIRNDTPLSPLAVAVLQL